MDAQNKTRPFGMRDYFGYAMGDFGCNMSFALITNYLMLFYTQYIGLRLSDWAWIIVVGKVWDAINDPLIGGMVDNVRIGKGSKRVPGMRRRRTGALAYGAPVMWSATACHATRN